MQYNFIGLRNDLKKYISKIEQAKEILEEVYILENVYDDMQKNLEIARNNQIDQEK